MRGKKPITGAMTCERRLRPFIERRECGADATVRLECRPFGAHTNPSAIMRVTFCAAHADEYIASGHGWAVVETFPTLHPRDLAELSLSSLPGAR